MSGVNAVRSVSNDFGVSTGTEGGSARISMRCCLADLPDGAWESIWRIIGGLLARWVRR